MKSLWKRYPACLGTGSLLLMLSIALLGRFSTTRVQDDLTHAIFCFAFGIGVIGLAFGLHHCDPPPKPITPPKPRPKLTPKTLIPDNVIPDPAAPEGNFSRN